MKSLKGLLYTRVSSKITTCPLLYICTLSMYSSTYIPIYLCLYLAITYRFTYTILLYVLQVYFGTQHARMYLLAAVLGINCVTGMSCLFRKAVLDEAGGIQTLGTYLAEDFYLGHLFISRYRLMQTHCMKRRLTLQNKNKGKSKAPLSHAEHARLCSSSSDCLDLVMP